MHLLQLHQTIKYADLNDRGDADADLNGSEMLICRSQDQQMISTIMIVRISL